MRVLFWSDLFWPFIGGSEVFAAKLLMALRERHEFAVITRHDRPDLPLEDCYGGIAVYRFPFLLPVARRDIGGLLALRQQVAALKRSFEPQLIHIHNFGPSLLFHHETHRVSGVPVLFTATWEGFSGDHRGADTLIGWTLRGADWVTAVSRHMLAQLHARAPEIRSRSSVILNGLDFPAALPEPMPADGHRLLCLGRLHFQKGFDLALSALAAIVDRFPNARLTIAGDGPERAALERRAYELNLSGVVDFIGWVSPDKVAELLNAATLVLMPSRSEPFGLVALEAASMARPVIASRVGGLPEVVVDGTTGLLVDAENSQELAKAIAVMLTHPQQAAQMGQAGRSRARECFDWNYCVDSYDELYQKLAGGGAGERTQASRRRIVEEPTQSHGGFSPRRSQRNTTSK